MQDFSVPNVGTAAIHSAVPAPDGYRLARGARVQQDRAMGSQHAEDHRIPGSISPGQRRRAGGRKQAHHPIGSRPATYGRVARRSLNLIRRRQNSRASMPTRLPAMTSSRIRMAISGLPVRKQDWQGRWQDDESHPVGGSHEQGFPRRMEIAPDGIVWVGEFTAGKMARFDPATANVSGISVPGPAPTPYAMGFDADGISLVRLALDGFAGSLRYKDRAGNRISFSRIQKLPCGSFSVMRKGTCGTAAIRIIKSDTSTWRAAAGASPRAVSRAHAESWSFSARFPYAIRNRKASRDYPPESIFASQRRAPRGPAG